MAKAGRKSYFEELNIAQRYSDLTEPAFKVLREMLASDEKQDQKWAVEQLSKAFVKMIPQDLNLDGKMEHSLDEETSSLISKALEDI